MNSEKGFRPKPTPVKVGDEMETVIEAVGEKGDGIAKKEGFVLFVPDTHKGDRVRIRVTKVLKSVGFAEVIGKSESKKEEESEGESDEEVEESDESGDESEEDTEDFGEEEK